MNDCKRGNPFFVAASGGIAILLFKSQLRFLNNYLCVLYTTLNTQHMIDIVVSNIIFRVLFEKRESS